MKRLFLLAGTACSGKSSLSLACRKDPDLRLFGPQSAHLKWQLGYRVVGKGRKIVFEEKPAGDLSSASIKGFAMYPRAKLVDPPDGLLVHVDLFTLGKVDNWKGPQSKAQLLDLFETGLDSLVGAYDQVFVTTLEVDRSELARRMLDRLIRRRGNLRMKSARQRFRVALASLLRGWLPEGVRDRVFGAVVGGGRQRIYFTDDGRWLQTIHDAWAEYSGRFATAAYRLRADTPDFVLTQVHPAPEASAAPSAQSVA